MPQVKYIGSKAKKQANLAEVQNNMLREELGGAIGRIKAKRKIPAYEIGVLLGYKQSNFSDKTRNPEKLTMGEALRWATEDPELRAVFIRVFEKCSMSKKGVSS